MALSLRIQEPKSTLYSPAQQDQLLSYSTPRRFNVNVLEDSISQEILPGMSKGQMTPLALLSTFEHASHDGMVMDTVSSSSQAILDLPSWTPLKVSEDDEGSSTSELDEPSTVVPRSKPLRATRTASELPSSSGLGAAAHLASVPSHPKRDIKKKARFAGVVIVSKRRPLAQSNTSQSRPASHREVTSESNTLNLLDALKHTFDANQHVAASPLPGRVARLRTQAAQEQGHDASSTPGPQTDIEAGSTEPEDETLQSNKRVLPPRTLKKRLPRVARATLSESNNYSEDATSASRDTSARPERPAKRLKPISYDTHAAFIDASLGTVQAPITWDAGPDLITNDPLFIRQLLPPEKTTSDVPMDIDGVPHTTNHARHGVAPPLGQVVVVGNPRHAPALRLPRKAVLSPYIPRGDKFKDRLVSMFGENATVRLDRAARPKPAAIDLFASLDDLDRESSPNPSESSASESPATTAEELMNTMPSTQFTSQSPELPPTTTLSSLHAALEKHQLDGKDKVAFETNEGQNNGWITALQRLVKGKVRAHDEDLEMLSVVLAEIESVKDSLDTRGPTNVELRECLKQLSELQEIPFGDRNNLRRRAGKILIGWPSSA